MAEPENTNSPEKLDDTKTTHETADTRMNASGQEHSTHYMLHFSALRALCGQVTFQKATKESDVLHASMVCAGKCTAVTAVRRHLHSKVSQRQLRHDICPLDLLLILPMPWQSNERDRHVLAAGIRPESSHRAVSLVCVPSHICTARCKTAVTMAWWMNTWTHIFLYRFAQTPCSTHLPSRWYGFKGLHTRPVVRQFEVHTRCNAVHRFH